jgi:hypothetical protein
MPPAGAVDAATAPGTPDVIDPPPPEAPHRHRRRRRQTTDGD